MKKFISIILVVVMVISVISMLSFGASAADASDIVNLYDVGKASVGIAQTKDGAPSVDNNHHSSAAIAVSGGDKITVGPIFKDQGFIIMGFDASGKVTASKVKPAALAKTDIICNNAVILTYTVPAGTEYIRLITSQMFYDSTLITKNREYTKDEYFAYMDSKGINIDYLRPTTTAETIENKFPISSMTFAGAYNVKNGAVTPELGVAFRSSTFIPVQHGDVIYFAAADQSQGWHLCLRDANGKGTTTVGSKYMVLYEDLGRGYAIYAYRMRPGTARVSVIVKTGVYDDGIALATINQPFTCDTYKKMFNISADTYDVLDETSPLNGLTGLFMGDSISYGAFDSPSYIDPYTDKAWAGRIAAMTGLKATNVSVSGATCAYNTNANKWLFNQHINYVGRKFDIIVMHGGVNDAIHFSDRFGSIKPVSSSASELESNIGTFCGGLQWVFYNVKTKFPGSTLFFISNFHIDGFAKGDAKDMSAYFNIAEELCEMYGIHYIDLYNNKELNDKLEFTTKKYLPDLLHPNADAYDIITPYILEEIEAVMAPAETTPVETTPVETTPVVTPADTEPPVQGGCGSAVALGAMAMISTAGVALVKKKKL